MDIGLAFDDEDLQINSKDKTGDHHLPYNVKICNPKWFELADAFNGDDKKDIVLEEHDLEQLQKMLKFDADLHYRNQDYFRASQRYEKVLDILPSSNISVRLDVKESLSRCYIYMGLDDKCLLLAQEMAEEFNKEDESRYRQYLMLMSFIYEKTEKWKECIENLETLCQLQPFFPQTWHKLGDMYSNFQSGDTMSSEISRHLSVKQLTCFLRARCLLLSVMGNASQFVKNRNTIMIEELSKKIEELELPLPDSEKTFAHQYIEKEIENLCTGNKEDLQETDEDRGNYSSGSFYSRFCSWHILYKRSKR